VIEIIRDKTAAITPNDAMDFFQYWSTRPQTGLELMRRSALSALNEA